MSDGVKFIFKTLIKVPVYICTAYLIFNIFSFFFIYFKLLGLSYVVMQEVVDKNYLTESQLSQIRKSMLEIDNMDMAMHSGIIVGQDKDTGKNVWISIDINENGQIDSKQRRLHVTSDKLADESTVYDASKINNTYGFSAGTSDSKKQYGAIRYIGVRCRYKLIWPLDMTTEDGDGTFMDDSNRYNNDNEYAENGTVQYNKTEVTIPIEIIYTVPGLKYYADM